MISSTLKLNSGHQMPLVGFGLWKVSNETCASQVYNAIKAGYRLFDGACGKSSTLSENFGPSFHAVANFKPITRLWQRDRMWEGCSQGHQRWSGAA